MTTETNQLIPVETKKILDDIAGFCDGNSVSVALKISSNEQFAAAGELVKKLKEHSKTVEAQFRAVKDPVVKQGKSIDDYFRPHTQKIKMRIDAINNALFAWDRAVKEKARQAQIEADRKAAEERAKLQAQAEAASAKADEYIADGRLDKAEQWAGKAATKTMQAETVTAKPIDAQKFEAPKVAGVSLRTTWKGKTIDKKALMTWAVQSGMINLFDINESALNAQARACKGEMQIPGVEWFEAPTTATR